MNDLAIADDQFESLGVSTNDGVFVFTPIQKRFLKNLKTLKDVEGAALSVGWDAKHGMQFVNGRKFRKFLASKMQDKMTQEAMTEERWWQFCRGLTDGYLEKARGTCAVCKWSDTLTMYEVEMAKREDLTLDFHCPTCGQQAVVEVTQEPFKKTREQVVGWQEWGARKTPKIERIQHEFSSESFIFKTEDSV